MPDCLVYRPPLTLRITSRTLKQPLDSRVVLQDSCIAFHLQQWFSTALML